MQARASDSHWHCRRRGKTAERQCEIDVLNKKPDLPSIAAHYQSDAFSQSAQSCSDSGECSLVRLDSVALRAVTLRRDVHTQKQMQPLKLLGLGDKQQTTIKCLLHLTQQRDRPRLRRSICLQIQQQLPATVFGWFTKLQLQLQQRAVAVVPY